MYNPHQSNRNLSYSSTSQPSSNAYALINAAPSTSTSTGGFSARYPFSESIHSNPGSYPSSNYTAANQSRNPKSSTTTPLNNSPAPYVPQPRVYPNLVEHRRNLAHHHSSSRRNNEPPEDSCSEDTCSEISLPSSPDPSSGQATHNWVSEQAQQYQQEQCSRTDHPSLRNPIPIAGHVAPDSEKPVVGLRERNSSTSSSEGTSKEGKRKLRDLVPRNVRQADIAAKRAKGSASRRYQSTHEDGV